MLRTGAVLTRAGQITYTRGELGLDGDPAEPITIDRTLETISHPDTLASLRGAPLTLLHPPKGVDPDNYQAVTVGAVAGEPRVMGDTVVGDLYIGDREALDELDRGVSEVSIGYDFVLTAGNRTSGPLLTNHVALVPKGRAGPSVRVLDSVEDDMTREEMIDAMSTAIDMGMKKHRMDGLDAEGMKKTFMDALSPLADGLKALTDAQDAAAKTAAAAEAKQKAQDAAKKLTDEVKATERARYAVLTEALPLIDEAQHATVAAMETHDILVTALGDSVPNAKDQSTDYLMGALAIAKAQRDAAGGGAPGTGGQPAGGTGSGPLPPGVRQYSARDMAHGDARVKALDEFVDAQAKAYSEAGGI